MSEMTAGQIRLLKRRVAREADKFAEEQKHLEFGQGAIAKRITSLMADRRACQDYYEYLDGLEMKALAFRRRLTVSDDRSYPRYNRHRRLAVMERSFL